jgi:hypothetical protein
VIVSGDVCQAHRISACGGLYPDFEIAISAPIRRVRQQLSVGRDGRLRGQTGVGGEPLEHEIVGRFAKMTPRGEEDRDQNGGGDAERNAPPRQRGRRYPLEDRDVGCRAPILRSARVDSKRVSRNLRLAMPLINNNLQLSHRRTRLSRPPITAFIQIYSLNSGAVGSFRIFCCGACGPGGPPHQTLLPWVPWVLVENSVTSDVVFKGVRSGRLGSFCNTDIF